MKFSNENPKKDHITYEHYKHIARVKAIPSDWPEKYYMWAFPDFLPNVGWQILRIKVKN